MWSHKYSIINVINMIEEEIIYTPYEYRKQMEDTKDGLSVEIKADNSDIQLAVDDVLLELYLYYQDKMHISLKINDIAIVFYKHKRKGTDIFKVFGRKYTQGYDAPVIIPFPLGEISTEKWMFYPSFCNHIYPLFENWVKTITS